MGKFFGFGGYGEPDGFLSWQHILVVSTFVILGVSLAIILGKLNKNKDIKTKNKVLIWAAIIIDAFEIIKIIIGCIQSPDYWRVSLPLFLCSIQLITIPLAAFCKGRVKEASLDFVLIFGILGGILGTVGASQNYNTYPAFSWPNIVSGTTHTISAFASLYIAISGMVSLKKKNLWIVFAILFGFAIAAYIANIVLDYNYMFLMYHDGTPYQFLYDLVNGNKVLYPMIVVGLFVLYIFIFESIYHYVLKRNSKKTA